MTFNTANILKSVKENALRTNTNSNFSRNFREKIYKRKLNNSTYALSKGFSSSKKNNVSLVKQSDSKVIDEKDEVSSRVLNLDKNLGLLPSKPVRRMTQSFSEQKPQSKRAIKDKKSKIRKRRDNIHHRIGYNSKKSPNKSQIINDNSISNLPRNLSQTSYLSNFKSSNFRNSITLKKSTRNKKQRNVKRGDYHADEVDEDCNHNKSNIILKQQKKNIKLQKEKIEKLKEQISERENVIKRQEKEGSHYESEVERLTKLLKYYPPTSDIIQQDGSSSHLKSEIIKSKETEVDFINTNGKLAEISISNFEGLRKDSQAFKICEKFLEFLAKQKTIPENTLNQLTKEAKKFSRKSEQQIIIDNKKKIQNIKSAREAFKEGTDIKLFEELINDNEALEKLKELGGNIVRSLDTGGSV